MGVKTRPESCPETTTTDCNSPISKCPGIPSDILVFDSLIQKSFQPNIIERRTNLSSENSSMSCQTSVASFTALFSTLSPHSESSIESQHSMQSQTSLPSHGSLQSELSLSSQSMQSQTSLPSHGSLQSELSLSSQSSLGFLPSLRRLQSDGVKEGTDYRCVSTLKGHHGQVSSLALAGELLYSGSNSNDIKSWLHADETECCRFGTGKGIVKAFVIAGDRIFTAHQDHKIRVWERSQQQQKIAHKLVATLPTVRDCLVSFILPTNYVQVRRHKKHLWIKHVDTISVLAVSRKDDVLYSGSWDRNVKVWRLSDFKCLESFKAHDDAINAIALSEEGYVYTASADAKIKVWLKGMTREKKRNHSLIITLVGHKSAVNALALSSDASILYSGACDRAIVVWEREDSAQHMTVAGALRGHRHAILTLASVGDILCSGSADKTIRVWKRESGTVRHSCLAVLEGHRAAVKCVCVCLDNTSKICSCMVYSGSLDGDIKVWCVSSSM